MVLLAAPEHVDAMVAALDGKHGRLVRRRLTAEAAQALEDCRRRQSAGGPAGRRLI